MVSVTVPGGGRSRGCHGYLLLMLEHARLHQLCRHQRPCSSIGDEFNLIFLPYFLQLQRHVEHEWLLKESLVLSHSLTVHEIGYVCFFSSI